jgi:Zn-dependent protease with chaperone function
MKNSNMRFALRLLPGVLLLGIAGCSLLNKAIETTNALEEMNVVDNLEPSEQYYLGRGVSAVVTDKYRPVEIKDARTENQILYLNSMAGYIEVSSQDVTRSALRLGDYTDRGSEQQERVNNLSLYKGIQVGILDTDEPAAFATAGGFLWISRGLIDMCNNEDELAAIVAHESAHIILDHGMNNYRRAHKNKIVTSTLSETWFSGSGPAANFGRLCVTLGESAFNGYKPGQEFEADSWGVRALAESGYAPQALITMLERIQEYEESHAVDPEDYLAHHPPVEERIAAVKKLIADEELKFNSDSMSPGALEARQKRFNAAFR